MTPSRFARHFLAIPLTALLFGGLLPACSDSSNSGTPLPREEALAAYNDPGTGEWETVAPDRLIEECGLDPDILAEVDRNATHSYAIVRYGKLCHEFYHPDDPAPDEAAYNASATKTLGAVAVGRAVLMSADLPRPLNDTDRMDTWVDNITFNPDALVAHVLAMVAFNESLSYGQREFVYDGDGSREINRLIDVIEAVLAQDPGHFSDAGTLEQFARREIFDRLGMDNSYWDGKSMGVGWYSDLRDMARMGLLLINKGVWDQQRILSEEWVFKMTHPAFEDANTIYGYLTWLAAPPLVFCQPFALWPSYPHPLSDSPDCNYGGTYSCMQQYDVGVFAANGAGGQLIVGHRGLDLVLVTRNAGPGSLISAPWDMVRPALVAHDPVYAGNEEAFCAAYIAGDHAPDLIVPDN